MSDQRRARGVAGEDLAARWYEARGAAVLARNWRSTAGELDLVVRDGATIVFCEVKTRTTSVYGSPFEAVTGPKQRRIRRLAAQWLAEGGHHPAHVRFDVAGVLGGALEVIEDAF